MVVFVICSCAREVSITGKMTVERGQQSQTVDPQASLRTELVGQLASAQLALEAAIADLVRSGADSATLAISRSQLTSVISLRQQIGASSSSALAHLRSEVASAATAALATAQQASGATGNADRAGGSMTPQAARQTIETIGHDIFDRKVLDPYLQFSSAEDEAAYRKREQERKAEIDRALALHTPEGDRRAAELTRTQLDDAKAHGADRSPDYAWLSSQTDEALNALKSPTREATPDAGKSKASTRAAVSLSGDDLGDVMAALKAAGVESNSGDAPSGGHGVSKIAAGANAQKTPTGRG